MSEALQVLGGLGATAAAAVALLTARPQLRSAAMLVALLLAGALVAGEAWHGEVQELRDTPAKLAALTVGGIAAVAALVAVCNRHPILLPLALLAALPFRIPVDAGGESSNLLLPLYAVTAAGVLLSFSGRSSTDSSSASSTGGSSASPPGPPGVGHKPGGPDRPGMARPVRWLSIALAASIVLYAAQSAYSSDVSRAVQNIAFFLVPFAVMFTLLRETEWTPRLLTAAAGVVIGEAIIFALIGIAQHEVGEIFWNSKVMESNEFDAYFRVNSLFWDPNIYGRYLALAALLAVAVLVWIDDFRRVALGALAVAVIFVGMAFSFSQTSFFALIVGLAVLCALRWSLRWTALAAVAALLATGGLIGFTDALEVDSGSSDSLEKTTSGRSTLVSGGLDLARDRPVAGYGSGSFAVEFEKDNSVPEGEAAVSHTEPVTVAAEQGIVGLAAYAAVLLASLLVVFGGLRSVAPGLGGTMPWGLDAGTVARYRAMGRIAIAAALAGMLAHTIGYAGFLTDPLSWALLALGSALADVGRPVPAVAPPVEESPPPEAPPAEVVPQPSAEPAEPPSRTEPAEPT